MAELNVSDVMRRLREGFEEKKKVRQKFRDTNHSVYEICMHILKRIVDPKLDRIDIPKQRVPDHIVPKLFDRSNVIQMQRLERNRIKAKTAFDDVCINYTEQAWHTFKRHEKRINEWRAKRYAEIDRKEKSWNLVADNMASVNEKRARVSREKVEQEWQNLIDCLPDGVQKDLLRNFDMPITDRAELCGGLATDSMFSRLRRQEEMDDHNKGVHWKLRHTVEEVAREFRERVDVSFDASIQTVGKNVVSEAKEEIGKALVQFSTINAGLKKQMDVISKNMSSEEKQDVRDAVAEEFRRRNVENMNRLADLR